MTASDIEILKIYVLLSPALVFLLGLGAMRIARWQDARDDRRRMHWTLHDSTVG